MKTSEIISNIIRNIILKNSQSERDEIFNDIKNKNSQNLTKMSMRSIEKWENFIKKVQIDCPSINDKDLQKLSNILSNLEISHTQYSLLSTLSTLDSSQLDQLHNLLSEWTLDMAKIVLDELKGRIALLAKLKEKVFDAETNEVQELQPLFHQGLWIFGPEYETIEFTSNEGMTRVIQKLFNASTKGSRHRPDFAILPDGTVGMYSYPHYDSEGSEIGTSRLTIVELKRPGIRIGEEQKAQCWKYVKELYENGLLDDQSKVSCFVLGSSIEPQEIEPRTEKNNHVIILPLDYNTLISRANSRLHRLYERVKNAPFLNKTDIDKFINLAEENNSQYTLLS